MWLLKTIPILLFMAGCVTARPTSTPSGRRGFIVSCIDKADCLEKARESCAGGYDIVESATRVSSAGTGVISSAEMVVECGSTKKRFLDAGGSSSSSGKPTRKKKDGTLNAGCYGNGTCNDGLSCVSGICRESCTAKSECREEGHICDAKAGVCAKNRNPDGAQHGRCYGNNTCNTGLVCKDNFCWPKPTEQPPEQPPEEPRKIIGVD